MVTGRSVADDSRGDEGLNQGMAKEVKGLARDKLLKENGQQFMIGYRGERSEGVGDTVLVEVDGIITQVE